VSGIVLGIAVAKIRWFDLAFTPLLDIILFAPTLVVIFLGIAIIGTQLLAIAVITTLAVAPNVAIYMRDVMRDFDPEIAAMADSYRASRVQRIRDVYLPYLVPPILAAARIGFSMSWKVILLSEVFGFSGGLGFQIRINYGIYDLVSLLAWLSIFVIALLAIEQLIRITERRVVKWQA
jgi:ABC-type nitrate/sulfonate/bicarbonate transport system permease component